MSLTINESVVYSIDDCKSLTRAEMLGIILVEYQCNGDVWEAIWSYSRLKEAVGVFIEKIEE